MSGTHVLDRPTYKDNLGEVAERTVQGCRNFGSNILSVVAGSVSRFETYMTARSLPEGYARRCGMTALADVDSTYAHQVQQRFDDLS